LPLGIDVQVLSSLEHVKGDEAVRSPPPRLEFNGRTMRIQLSTSTRFELAEPTDDWVVDTIRTSAGTGWVARQTVEAEGELPAGMRMVGVIELPGRRTFTAQAWTTNEDDLEIVREILMSVRDVPSRD
jgi:hypothetical protein